MTDAKPRSLPPTLGLALLYAGVFGIFGVELPFWPVYLSNKGISSVELAWLLAVPNFVKIVSNPLAGLWADHRGDRKLPLQTLAIINFATTFLFIATNHFWPLFALSLIAGGATAAMIPLSDNLTLTASSTLKLDYGRVRLWGSVSFIVISQGVGLLLVVEPPSWIVGVTLSVMCGLFLVTRFALPDVPMPAVQKEESKSLAPLIKGGVFPVFVLATSLVQLSHSTLYGFGTKLWFKADHSSWLVGSLWAESVVVEVVFFAFGSLLLKRLNPLHLMLLAAIGGAIRWSVLAVTTETFILVFAMALHALTYAACHLGAMAYMHQTVPHALSARAQGIYTAIAMGVAPGFGLLAAGNLYDSLGSGAYWPMAAACAFSLPLTLWLMRRFTTDSPPPSE